MVSTVEAGRLVVTPHPLTLEGQTNTPADLRAGESLLSFLERHVPNLHVCKYAVYVNGCQVAPELWARVKPKHGTIIAVRSVVEKKALQLVALAALTYFTFGIGSAGGFIATKFGTLAATAMFMGGSVLINKVLAPSVPKIGSTDLGREPVYSIAPSSNAARQHEALPLLLGSVRYAPDYASLPYTWYEGNEQMMGAIFNAGLNVDRFEGSLLNGNTALDSYQDVDVWTRGFSGMPEQAIPLFTNPDSIDGGELEGSGEWVTRITSLDTTLIQCDFEIQLYGQGSGMESRSLVIEGRYRQVGGGAWIATPTIRINNRSVKPLRRTESFGVELGQYEVAWRNATGGSSNDGKTVRNVNWTQLKSIQPDDGDYKGQSRVAIKVKATGQLSGSLKEIKGDFVARAMPVWNGSAWVQATTPENGLSNPGAQILLLARGIYVDDPDVSGGRRLVAGMGLPDDQIDIEGLKAFMLHCTANNLRHDALISDDRSNLDLMNQIARCGLGSFGYFNGKWGVVWAWDNQPLDGVVNMATIKKSTFQVSYELASAADGIVFTYLNRETWEQDSIYVYAPGKTTMLNPARVTGEGITNTEHAAVMARYHLGQSLYQFKDIQYETDLEHLDYQRMSVLAISHDMTQWGFGGRLVAAAQDEQGVVMLQLDAPVPAKSVHDEVNSSAAPFVGLRIPGEAVYRVFEVVRPAAGALTLTLKDPWPEDAIFPGDYDDNPAHDTLWFYDFKPTPGARVRVAGMQMQSGLGGAQVAVVPESDEFWNYVLNGTYEPAGSDSQLSRDETPIAKNLCVTEQQTVQGNTQFTELTITFDVSGEMASAEIWAAPEGYDLVRVADTFNRQATFRIDAAGNWMVQVRPMGHTRAGPVASVFYVTKAADLPPWNYDSLLITEIAGGLRRYAFEYLESDPPLDLAGAEIRYLAGTHAAPVWENMTPLAGGFHTAAFESVLPAEGVWTFALRARNTSGQLSTDVLVRTVTLGKNFDQVQTKDDTPPPTVTGLDVAAGFSTVIVSWTPASYETGHGHARTLVYAAQGAEATVAQAKQMAESYNGPVSFGAGLGETWRVWAKHESVDGVLSSDYAGPVTVKLGKVGEADLADDLDLAKQIADGSITAEKIADKALDESKFAQGVEPVKIIPDGSSLPTQKSSTYISWKGVLYTWNDKAGRYEETKTQIAGEVGGNNLCRDSSFELTAAGQTGLWHIYNNSGAGVGLRFDTGRQSGQCWVTVAGAAPGITLGAYAAVNGATFLKQWRAGVDYTVSFYARKKNGAGFTSANLRWNLPNPAQPLPNKRPNLTTEWQRYEFHLRFAADKTPELYITAEGTFVTGDEIWIDDVQVEEGTIVTAYAPHPSEILPGSITGVAIADDSITAPKIVAESIVARHIATKSITAEKLLIGGVSNNLVPDGAFDSGTLDAYLPFNAPAGSVAITDTRNGEAAWQVNSPARYGVLFSTRVSHSYPLTVDLFTHSATLNAVELQDGFLVAEGEKYQITFDVTRLGTPAANLRLFMRSYDRNMAASVSGIIYQETPTSVGHHQWVTRTVEYTIPAGKRMSRLQFNMNATTKPSSDGHYVVTNIRVEKKSGAVLIEDGAINANKLAVNAVSANHLQANSVTAGKVAAGAIGADQIAANAITTKHLVVADFDNLCTNGQFKVDNWGWDSSFAGHPQRTITSHVPCGSGGLFKVRDSRFGEPFDVSPGEQFSVSAYVWKAGTPIALFGIGLQVFDKAGTVITWIRGFTVQPGDSIGQKSGMVELPANAARAQIWVQYAHTTNVPQEGHFWSASNITIRRAASAELIVDGAITADKIQTGAVVAGKLAVNSVAANNIVAGAITVDKLAAGAVTTPKLAAGSVDASKLTANSVTADKIAANAVTAAKLSANSVTADKMAVNSVAAVHIQSKAITADKMAIGSITAENGAIANLSVDTLKIKGNAVSSSALFSRGTSLDINAPVDHDVATVTMKPPPGSSVLIMFAADCVFRGNFPANTFLTAYLRLEVEMDNGSRHQLLNVKMTEGYSGTGGSINHFTDGYVGYKSYFTTYAVTSGAVKAFHARVRVINGGASVRINETSLSVMELKK